MNFFYRFSPKQAVPLCVVLVLFVGSLWFSQKLAHSLATESKQTIEVWAEAYRRINTAAEDDPHLDYFAKIISENNSIPMVILDERKNMIGSRNLDSLLVSHPKRLERWLTRASEKHPPIKIDISPEQYNLIYYGDSDVLRQLEAFPYVLATVISIFVLLAQWSVYASRKAQQNKLWVGLSKETAHQLGTPISSLMAIKELLRENPSDPRLLHELEKDLTRLENITERFSKIGSRPALQPADIEASLQKSLQYIRSRSPKNVEIHYISHITPAQALLNEPLFEWVIENLCKNALDAINGSSGSITVELSSQKNHLSIDITDTGKGIPKKDFQSIFRTGFTTKTRGWGLGLTLAKRIIEDYHNGHIYVLKSEPNQFTTIRITLPG